MAAAADPFIHTLIHPLRPDHKFGEVLHDKPGAYLSADSGFLYIKDFPLPEHKLENLDEFLKLFVCEKITHLWIDAQTETYFPLMLKKVQNLTHFGLSGGPFQGVNMVDIPSSVRYLDWSHLLSFRHCYLYGLQTLQSLETLKLFIPISDSIRTLKEKNYAPLLGFPEDEPLFVNLFHPPDSLTCITFSTLLPPDPHNDWANLANSLSSSPYFVSVKHRIRSIQRKLYSGNADVETKAKPRIAICVALRNQHECRNLKKFYKPPATTELNSSSTVETVGLRVLTRTAPQFFALADPTIL